MSRNVLKVTVKDGCEQNFETYCKDKDIFCRAYPIKIFKTIYRAECKLEQLKDAEILIVKVEDMPVMILS